MTRFQFFFKGAEEWLNPNIRGDAGRHMDQQEDGRRVRNLFYHKEVSYQEKNMGYAVTNYAWEIWALTVSA